jgi:beta-N-acetylhexosaminidase
MVAPTSEGHQVTFYNPGGTIPDVKETTYMRLVLLEFTQMTDYITQKFSTALPFLVILLLAGAGTCALAQDSIFTGRPPTTQQIPEEESAGEAVDQAQPRPSDLRARIAQLMIITLSGTHGLGSEDRAFLNEYIPGAAVIAQLPRPSFAPEYLEQIRKFEATSGIPLLVGCDLYQLSKQQFIRAEGFPPLPSLLSIAAASDESAGHRLGQILARHMTAMGFDFYFGPSLALKSALSETPGTLHSFGEHPEFTTAASAALISAFRENGVAVMPTGFPGGGENRLPGQSAVLLTPETQLHERDLAPYIRAIDEGISFLHVGNTLTPTLASNRNPASLSNVVLKTLLRDELGYRGIAVVGPMDHPDIVGRIAPGEAAVIALENGADMLFFSNAGRMARAAIETVLAAVESGRLPQSIVDDAYQRIVETKDRLITKPRKLPKASAALKLEKDKKLLEESYQLERRAVTLVQNRGHLLPLSETASGPIGITGVVAVELLHDALEKHIKRIVQQPIMTARHLGEIQDFEIDRIVSRAQGIRTAIVVLGKKMRHDGPVRLIHELKKKGARVVVVLLGYPDMLDQVRDADAILLAFSDNDTPGTTIRAIADILIGKGPLAVLSVEHDFETTVGELRTFDATEVVRTPTGRLPVNVSDTYKSGLGVAYSPVPALKKVSWDFGNGKKSSDTVSTFAYAEPGSYQVTLTVTDHENQATSGTFNIAVHE